MALQDGAPEFWSLYHHVHQGEGAQGLEDLHQGNRNVTTGMEKAEVLLENDENTQGAWTYLQRWLVLVKRENHCSL